MVGMIGKVRTVPKPVSEVANEALNLLTALGGGNLDTKRVLEDMRAVQTANEKVYEDAKQATAEAVKRETAAAESEQSLMDSQQAVREADAERARQVVVDTQRLNEARAKLDGDTKAANEALQKREAAVKAGESDITGRLASLEDREARCAKDRSSLDEERASVRGRSEELDKTFARLRAVLPKE